MIGLVIAAGIFFVGVFLLYRQWRVGRGSAQFILGTLPLALCFLTLPLAFVSLETIREFQRIAVEGAGGAERVQRWCLSIAYTLWWANIGLLLAMAAALALQTFATRRPIASAAPDHGVSVSRWRRATLIVSSLLAVPVMLVAHLTRGITKLIMSALVGRLSSDQMGQLSSDISTRCVVGLYAGIGLSVLLLICVLANVLLMDPETEDTALTKYAIVVLIVMTSVGGSNVLGLAADTRWFEQSLPQF
jgi:hypothetical protein